MAWICGKHLSVEVPDGEPCASCNPLQEIKTRAIDGRETITVVRPGASGKGWSAAETAAQKAAYEAKGGTWGKNPTGGEKP